LDPTENPERLPVSDIASPGPIDPTSGQPDHDVEVTTLKSWLRQNAFSLLMTIGVFALVCIYLDPIDTLKVVFGLGLVIFIHELGHFLAAKACDVHVKTFSIGFGPAIPFCSYKSGETTYMLGIIPLGGYVSMVGEGDTAAEEEGEEDPRSFKHKSVGARMIIISAGVIMNVILGMICFMAAYLHGVQEKPAIIGSVESGSAAWRAGIHTDSEIKRIDSRENPVFNDIRPIVMSSGVGETVSLVIDYDSKQETLSVEPIRDEGIYYPQLGVAPTNRLTLSKSRRANYRPVSPGSPAAAAEPRFMPGDRIVAMSDPKELAKVTAIAADPRDKNQLDFADYVRRMVLLADKPITFHVLRLEDPASATPTAITVQPMFRSDLGMRMHMGKVVAIRRASPAEKAGVQARPLFSGSSTAGDTIAAVAIPLPGGKKRWFANGARPAEAAKDDEVIPLDPIRLPRQLDEWAYSGTALVDRPVEERNVTLVVLRNVEHTDKRITLPAMEYDTSYRFDRERVGNPNSPLPLVGLGLAYWVNAVVEELVPLPGGEKSPAAEAGVKKGDLIEAIRFYATLPDNSEKDGDWNPIKDKQWASVDSMLQGQTPAKIGLRIKRGEETVAIDVVALPDKTWALDERGLHFQEDFRIQKASDVSDALGLGMHRTLRFIKEVYLNLYAMASGRVSTKTMSGPLTIATVSYRIAGEDFWQFLLFLGMISVNLAVVNFLPIPVLDGGHMVFLILEKILGRPVPERVFAIAMYVGLALILALMFYVIKLDVQRLFFGIF